MLGANDSRNWMKASRIPSFLDVRRPKAQHELSCWALCSAATWCILQTHGEPPSTGFRDMSREHRYVHHALARILHEIPERTIWGYPCLSNEGTGEALWLATLLEPIRVSRLSPRPQVIQEIYFDEGTLHQRARKISLTLYQRYRRNTFQRIPWRRFEWGIG